jgi:hypothetical protein
MYAVQHFWVQSQHHPTQCTKDKISYRFPFPGCYSAAPSKTGKHCRSQLSSTVPASLEADPSSYSLSPLSDNLSFSCHQEYARPATTLSLSSRVFWSLAASCQLPDSCQLNFAACVAYKTKPRTMQSTSYCGCCGSASGSCLSL